MLRLLALSSFLLAGCQQIEVVCQQLEMEQDKEHCFFARWTVDIDLSGVQPVMPRSHIPPY